MNDRCSILVENNQKESLKTPINIKDVTEVAVEKLREISNIKQFVEIENYYKNKLLEKENIDA